MADEVMDTGPPPEGEDNGRSDDQNGGLVGSAAMRPVFLGNLNNNYTAADVKDIFERPIRPPEAPEAEVYAAIPVERVDLKRGYCFVFLQDAATEEDKLRAENFVSDINGMSVPNVSNALRAEFARGDGRIKRKEDDRRRRITPSETLFVVNFHEDTTKREDLQMLFEPFGELVRIDMKRNYAFVQFRTVEEATRAKEVTNGGKLDQSVLTVEFVARQRGDGESRGGNRRGGGDRDRGRRRGGPPEPAYRRRDEYRSSRRSPPRSYERRGRSRSRSRSPPRYRSRSPPRSRDYYYDDYDRRSYRDRDRSPEYSRRRSSPDRDRGYGDRDRGYGDRDRGYRA